MISIRNILKKLPVNFTKNQKYDRLSRKIIRKALSSNSNCIDIGSHRGEFLKLFTQFAPQGIHFGFEPLPYLYDILKQRFKGNYYIYNLALSDKQGTSKFQYVMSNPAYSSFKKRKYPKMNEKITEIKVNTDLLDNLLPPNKKIDFIKIDVEGAEFLVLKGAVNTIKRHKPIIIFEFGKGAADYYNTNPEQIYQLLTNDCKLTISLLSQWLKNESPLSENGFIEQFNKELNYYFIAHP